MKFRKEFEQINEECDTTNNITSLSNFSAIFSGALMLPTIPLNLVLIYVIVKHQNSKSRGFFYKVLLNIAFADLLTGIIADPSSVNFHIKETLRETITLGDTYLKHLSLFITDAIALITMTLLSFDRIVALIYPIKYHNGMKKWKENMLVGMIYPTAILLAVPYFKINFIRQLAVFTTINISVAIISLIVTAVIFKRYNKERKYVQNTVSTIPMNTNYNETSVTRSTSTVAIKPNNCKQSVNAPKVSTSLAKVQNKVTKTFLIMVCLFIAMYLPTCVTMLYMNTCGESCDCKVVHVMRDISVLSILSSSVFRPLNFLLTIKQLRRSVVGICLRKLTEKSSSGSSKFS